MFACRIHKGKLPLRLGMNKSVDTSLVRVEGGKTKNQSKRTLGCELINKLSHDMYSVGYDRIGTVSCARHIQSESYSNKKD